MKQNKQRLVIHFPRLGPYHIARIGAAVRTFQSLDWEVIALEVAGSDTTYDWRKESAASDWQRVTVFPDEEFERIPFRRLASGVKRELDRLSPNAVAICGYATGDARAALRWCRNHRATAILMTETRKADGNRVWWKEFFKARFVNRFDSALCGGVDHRDYLIELGMPRDRIHYGYDVVDNGHFAEQANRWQQSETLSTGPYFLSSNRFIVRKNLRSLLSAYDKYARLGDSRTDQSKIWPLVLLGDGEQRDELINLCRDLNIPIQIGTPWESGRSNPNSASRCVFFPGFRQIEELPRFYAHAGCFIHPAISEPWGLVLNEAMASSLPVLASRGTGSATDLLADGVNGWTFDADDAEVLSELMSNIANLTLASRTEMGMASHRIVEKTCPLSAFGHGLAAATKCARQTIR